MIIVRSSKHTLKFANQIKQDQLEELMDVYKSILQDYVDKIWNKELPLKINLSSKLLPESNGINHSWWKQVIYKNASEIIRANNKKKRTTKPEVKNVGMNLDYRFFDHDQNSSEFDEFISIKLPWFKDRKKHSKTINLPIKNHIHSNKLLDWTRKKTIKLTKKNDQFYIHFTYEKEEPTKKTTGKSLGIDVGYKTMIATSDKDLIGKDLEKIYEKISRKKQGSKSFNKTLTERDQRINYNINQMDLEDVNHLVVENLKNVKKNSKGKIFKKFNNKLQRWSYPKILLKLEHVCELNGIIFEKVSPAYTSQTCSSCGAIKKSNRQGEMYIYSTCNMEMNADINASINILHRGIYSPPNKKSEVYIK